MSQSEPEWITRARQTFQFHRSKLLENDKWTLPKTAKELKRSLGSVSEDVTLIRWWRTHENQLRRCDTAREALAYIRAKKKVMDLDEAV